MKVLLLSAVCLGLLLSSCGRSASSTGKAGSPEVLATVTFEIEDPAYPDGIGPYVHLDAPDEDLDHMRGANDIVYNGTALELVLDYPLRDEFKFSLTAPTPKGFTRAELARQIAVTYQRVYREEEESSKVPVVPPEKRKGLINRNETAGKYGIWGHDLSDLVMHTVEIYRQPDGTVQAYLGIDS